MFLKKHKKHKPYYTKEGYKQIYAPDSPSARENGYAPEHRVKAEKMLGEPLGNRVVHHKNGNKQDNRKRNLQVMTSAEHYKIHNK